MTMRNFNKRFINILHSLLGMGLAVYFYLVINYPSFSSVGAIGPIVNNFLFKLFGIFVYPLPIVMSYFYICELFNRGIRTKKALAIVTFFVSSAALNILYNLSSVGHIDSYRFKSIFFSYALPLTFLLYLLFREFVQQNLYGYKKPLYFITNIAMIFLILWNHRTLSEMSINILKKIIHLSVDDQYGGLLGGSIVSTLFVLLGVKGSFIFLITISLISSFYLLTLTGDFLTILFKSLIFYLKKLFSFNLNLNLKFKFNRRKRMKDYKNKNNNTFFNKKHDKKHDKSKINVDNIFKSQIKDPILKDKMEYSAKNKSAKLEAVLSEHGVDAKVNRYIIGPSITRFELSVPKGLRVKKVSALSDDIAMNLEAESVRIEAPIPGKNAVGVEIPNDVSEAVNFSSIIKKKDRRNHLEVVLGKNIVGEDILVDLKKMPHLLVAGRTGSGKSVGINVIISSILYSASPEDVKFIMIDPKMVELMPYNGIPHLYVPVITNPKLADNALKWAVNEMEKRYNLLAKAGVRHLDSYNSKASEKIPYLIIIIDELADLMMVAPASIENSIARIAQKARAVGIHLVIATQRPSVDVITGTIKANLPSRISFAVTSHIDSRTIVDSQGAEKLLGRGDMLFLESGKSHLVRIQCAYISDDEVNGFVKYLKSRGKPQYRNEIIEQEEMKKDSNRDELYDRAVTVIKHEGKVSTTLLQRKLGVGYSRAARMIDQLESAGVIKVGKKGEKELLIKGDNISENK